MPPPPLCPPLPSLCQVTEHAQGRIRVQVSSREGSVPQGGYKVSLMGLIVGHIPLRTKTKLDTLQSQ